MSEVREKIKATAERDGAKLTIEAEGDLAVREAFNLLSDLLSEDDWDELEDDEWEPVAVEGSEDSHHIEPLATTIRGKQWIPAEARWEALSEEAFKHIRDERQRARNALESVIAWAQSWNNFQPHDIAESRKDAATVNNTRMNSIIAMCRDGLGDIK